MAGARAGREPGADVRFSMLLPANWRVLDLDPDTRDRSAERMVRQALGSSDRLASFRRAATRAYREMLREATDSGAFFAATMAEEVSGGALSASLIAFLGSSPEEAEGRDTGVGWLLDALSDPVPDEDPVTPPALADLPVGRAVRTRARVAGGVEGSGGRQPVVDVTRYFVPVPAWDKMLVMAFSTPTLPAADAFAELFDQLARGARWRR